MKKILSALLASVMVLAMLAGCSNQPSASSNPPAESNPPAAASQPAENNNNESTGGKTITMWSMWSSGEPQANVI